MDYVTIPEKQIKITDSFDVLVAGGGMTGIAAAICAAKMAIESGNVRKVDVNKLREILKSQKVILDQGIPI